MELINKKENIFGDNIAFVEQYDFSTANMSEENRIKAITQVASICYQNPKAVGSESLYNRLLAESKGLPSSSFEFVPVLFKYQWLKVYFDVKSNMTLEESHILKYGEVIYVDDVKYLLTNYRAVVYDYENFGIELRSQFNTPEECEIIKQHFKVFLYKVDLPTRSQMVRHRISWQELSRRYVSGKRKKFEFYVSDKMKDVNINFSGKSAKGEKKFDIDINMYEIFILAESFYNQALSQGVKPEEARRILPQACYTEIWGAYQPSQLKNFYNLRLDSHAQREIRLVAEAMKELENDNK